MIVGTGPCPAFSIFFKHLSKVSVGQFWRQATGIIQLLNKEEDMMKEAYAQSIECEEPCEGRLSRTVL